MERGESTGSSGMGYMLRSRWDQTSWMAIGGFIAIAGILRVCVERYPSVYQAMGDGSCLCLAFEGYIRSVSVMDI